MKLAILKVCCTIDYGDLNSLFLLIYLIWSYGYYLVLRIFLFVFFTLRVLIFTGVWYFFCYGSGSSLSAVGCIFASVCGSATAMKKVLDLMVLPNLTQMKKDYYFMSGFGLFGGNELRIT